MFNKKSFYITILSFCSLVFFFIYFFLYTDINRLISAESDIVFPPHIILNQPDESMNYFFIRKFVLESQFRVPQPDSEIAFDQIHPRSTTVVGGSLVPIGFPGFIILCGLLLKILVFFFGSPFFNVFALSLTPLAGTTAPLFLFFSLKRLFEEKTAFVSAFLLYIMPAWWYYASRPFQHNTLFVFFLILFFYMYSFFLEDKPVSSVKIFLIGLFFSLSVYIRPSEFVWLFILAVALCFISQKFWNFKTYFYAGLGVLSVALLFFATQYAYYGHPFGSGYVVPENGSAGLITSGPQGIPFLQALIAPFGLHLFAILRNAYYYLGVLFWPWSLMFIFFFISLIFFLSAFARRPQVSKELKDEDGFAVAVAKTDGWLRRISLDSFISKHRAPVKVLGMHCDFSCDASSRKNSKYQHIPPKRFYHYLAMFVFVSLYLLLYYGSWSFFDNLAGKPSIASSHVRYFLPLYLGALPFFGLFFSGLISYLKRTGIVLTVFCFFGLFAVSYRIVFTSFEGLSHVKQTTNTYYDWQKQVLSYVEPGAFIVTRYADKYLFPHRNLIPGLLSSVSYEAVKALLDDNKAVFYFDLKLPADDLSWQEDMQRYGFDLSASLWSVEDLELRRIEKNRVPR